MEEIVAIIKNQLPQCRDLRRSDPPRSCRVVTAAALLLSTTSRMFRVAGTVAVDALIDIVLASRPLFFTEQWFLLYYFKIRIIKCLMINK